MSRLALRKKNWVVHILVGKLIVGCRRKIGKHFIIDNISISSSESLYEPGEQMTRSKHAIDTQTGQGKGKHPGKPAWNKRKANTQFALE